MIILGAFFILLQVYENLSAPSPKMVNLDRQRRKAISELRFRWTDGVIPYEFLPGHFNSTERAMGIEAMKIWSDNTCLQFRPATSSDKNKVVYTGGNACYSMIGMVGGKQYITMGRNCRKLGLFLHEIGHAIGLFHEHQLPGRDEHIYVNSGNIYSGSHTEFKKLKPEQVNDYGVGYDLTSIMHYGKYAMSGRSGYKTMESRNRDENYLIVPVADKTMISFSDIKVVNLMYNCSKDCSDDIPCASPGFLDKDCKCVEPFYIEYCKNKDPQCEKWKKRGQCEARDGKVFMEITCPISCGYCSPRDGLTHEVFPTEPPKEIDCRDKNSQCQMWVNNNQCSENKLYMEDTCPVACGFCEPEGGRPTTPPPTEEPCTNKYGDSSCNKWAKGGQCSTNPGFMLKQCRMACRVCTSGEATGGSTAEEEEEGEETAEEGETTGGNTGGEEEEEEEEEEACENTYGDSSCTNWAKRGECRSNPGFMHKQCTKACGLCSGGQGNAGQEETTSEHTGGEKETASDCVDKERLCDSWAKAGYCATNGYTQKNCKKTCGTC